METMGYIFGLAGLSFALMAWEKIATLRKEFESLKQQLEQGGVLKKEKGTGNE